MCAAITGYGETELGEVPGYGYEEMNMWAASEAMDDAGIGPQDVDGFVVTPGMDGDALPIPVMAEYLGIAPISWGETTGLGGASHVHSITQAVEAVEEGHAETVLVVAADSFTSALGRDGAVELMAETASRFEEPSNIIPSLYAHVASWYKDKYGVTDEQLAKIAEIDYKHASMQREERAHMNEARSVNEILESPMIAEPLTMRQCSLVSDGGGAFIVTTDENARNHTDVPIKLRGFGSEHTHEHISQMPDFSRTGAGAAGKKAMQEAGVSHDDIDVMEIYDCFTITVLRVLEDLGFCELGEGGELAESGDLNLGGKWPMNTHGGAIAHVHPGMPSGMFHVTEAIRQLRGEAEATQVDGAERALVHGNGGILSTQSVAILERGD